MFLSAYDNESYIVEGLEAGGDDYVLKPFRTLELLARIKSLLKHSNQIQEQRRPEGIRSGLYFLDLNSHTVYAKKHAAELLFRYMHIIIFGIFYMIRVVIVVSRLLKAERQDKVRNHQILYALGMETAFFRKMRYIEVVLECRSAFVLGQKRSEHINKENKITDNN